MAVPTLANIYPAQAHTSGRALVRLLGSGFAEQIRVSFGDAASARVLRVKDSLAYVSVPVGQAGETVVRVENLDLNGQPIAGEVVESADLFAYERVALTEDSTLARVVEAFVKMLRAQIIDNVTVAHVHTDYDASTGDGYNLTEVQKLPALVVVGPEIVESEGEVAGMMLVPGFGYQVVTLPHYQADLLFDLTGMSAYVRQLLNLQNAVVAAFRLHPYIDVLKDPSDPAQGTVRFPVEFELGGAPSINAPSDDNNVRVFGLRAVIRNVPLGELPGLEDDGSGGSDVVPPVGDCGVELTFTKL